MHGSGSRILAKVNGVILDLCTAACSDRPKTEKCKESKVWLL